jgi:hypothetical protein
MVSLRDSTINEIAKKNKEPMGILELINISDERIKIVQSDIIHNTFQVTESGMDIIVKFKDCILDNISLRL